MSTKDDTPRRKPATKRFSKHPTARTESTPIASTYPPPPASILKRGLLRAETNKGSAQELALPTGHLAAAFGKTLFEKIQAALEPTDREG